MRPVIPVLLAAIAAAALPAAAHASPKLPPGADAPPVLPPGVIAAEAPVETGAAQRPSAAGPLRRPGAVASRKRRLLDLDPWATVNICDTANMPNALGVRAAMPGTGRRQLMFMRFTAQYWSPSADAWLDVPGNGRSRWVYAGSARYATQQTGWTFAFEQPPPGTTFVMRAVVEQEWRGPDGVEDAAEGLRHGAKRRGAVQRRHGAKRRGSVQRRHGAKRRVQMQRFRQPARPVQSRVASKADPRARWAVAKQRTLLTETGVTGVDGGDPPGTSKAMCLIW